MISFILLIIHSIDFAPLIIIIFNLDSSKKTKSCSMHLMKTHPNGDNEKTEKKRESKRFGQHFNRGWRGALLERLLYSLFIFAQKHPGWQLSQFRKQDLMRFILGSFNCAPDRVAIQKPKPREIKYILA